jgi:hypothetical protein
MKALPAKLTATATGTKRITAKAAKFKSSHWYQDAVRSIGITKLKPPYNRDTRLK